MKCHTYFRNVWTYATAPYGGEKSLLRGWNSLTHPHPPTKIIRSSTNVTDDFVLSEHEISLKRYINPLPAKLFNLNFHPLEVVSRWRDPQLQVIENYSDLTK